MGDTGRAGGHCDNLAGCRVGCHYWRLGNLLGLARRPGPGLLHGGLQNRRWRRQCFGHWQLVHRLACVGIKRDRGTQGRDHQVSGGNVGLANGCRLLAVPATHIRGHLPTPLQGNPFKRPGGEETGGNTLGTGTHNNQVHNGTSPLLLSPGQGLTRVCSTSE